MQTKQDVGWPFVLFAYKQSRCMFYLCSVRHKRPSFQMEKQCKNGNNFRLCQLSGHWAIPCFLKTLATKVIVYIPTKMKELHTSNRITLGIGTSWAVHPWPLVALYYGKIKFILNRTAFMLFSNIMRQSVRIKHFLRRESTHTKTKYKSKEHNFQLNPSWSKKSGWGSLI